jgi:hypothetical protein
MEIKNKYRKYDDDIVRNIREFDQHLKHLKEKLDFLSYYECSPHQSFAEILIAKDGRNERAISIFMQLVEKYLPNSRHALNSTKTKESILSLRGRSLILELQDFINKLKKLDLRKIDGFDIENFTRECRNKIYLLSDIVNIYRAVFIYNSTISPRGKRQPVCRIFGVKELYEKEFSTKEAKNAFLRWLEKEVEKHQPRNGEPHSKIFVGFLDLLNFHKGQFDEDTFYKKSRIFHTFTSDMIDMLNSIKNIQRTLYDVKKNCAIENPRKRLMRMIHAKTLKRNQGLMTDMIIKQEQVLINFHHYKY